MAGAEKEKLLGSVGLAELIRRIKAAIEAAVAPPDGVTIDENDDGELEAVMDKDGGVTSYERHLADIVTADEVTITKSEDNVVGLKPGGIQPDHLSNGCVTTDKIASSAVTSDKLADGSVETNAIADSSVTPEKLFGVIPQEHGGTGCTSLAESLSSAGMPLVCNATVSLNDSGKPVVTATLPDGFATSSYRFIRLFVVSFLQTYPIRSEWFYFAPSIKLEVLRNMAPSGSMQNYTFVMAKSSGSLNTVEAETLSGTATISESSIEIEINRTNVELNNPVVTVELLP